MACERINCGKANLIATLNQGLAFRTGKKEKPGLISFYSTNNSISVLMFRKGTKTIDLFDKTQSHTIKITLNGFGLLIKNDYCLLS